MPSVILQSEAAETADSGGGRNNRQKSAPRSTFCRRPQGHLTSCPAADDLWNWKLSFIPKLNPLEREGGGVPTVRDIMTRDIRTISCSASLAEAEWMILDAHLPELFVVDANGFAVGIIPDYAILKWHLSHGGSPPDLDAVISRRFLVIGPDAPLEVAARYLREHLHQRLAVVEDRRLIGTITRTSVLRAIVLSENQQGKEAAAHQRHCDPAASRPASHRSRSHNSQYC
jgi:CBS domain-containing protein